jgi:hypothetical protein
LADQASEIMGKWEDEIMGSSVNPVRKDRALPRLIYKEFKFYLYNPRHKWRRFLTG